MWSNHWPSFIHIQYIYMLYMLRLLLLCLLTITALPTFALSERNSAEQQGETALFETWRANTSEPVCRASLTQQLIQQQIIFSDGKNSALARRFAEEGIELARSVFDKSKSYCEASFALSQYVENGVAKETRIPKTGQVQKFRSEP